MEPTNDHEREIASIIDERARSTHDKLDYKTISEVTRVLSFPMSRRESQFLVAYVQWRIDHPISGGPATTPTEGHIK